MEDSDPSTSLDPPVSPDGVGRTAVPTRRSERVTPETPRWHQRSVVAMLCGLERCLTWTLRPTWDDQSYYFDPSKPSRQVIFCIWHNRLALAMWLYRAFALHHQPQRRLAAMVSASKDGAWMTAVLNHFRVQPVRGSTTRRGSQALLELTRLAEKGYDLAITPDGPRGPRYSVQDGILAAAQVTGLPILPVGGKVYSKWELKSWDRFQVPKPFAKVHVVIGQPIFVPRTLSSADREALRQDLSQRMRILTHD
jgi:lysophospholipid acyltransferase (LPLAT)-like uncharacterized protein